MVPPAGPTCAECGSALAVHARFCAICGTPAPPECRSCAARLAPEARFCARCGTAVEPTGRAREPVAERRVTSVLFGDLVGFTALSESRDPEDVRELLSAYFDRCRAVVERYGGTIEKFIGDAVMAVWGVPVAHEDDAERAVRAGLDLVDTVERFGETVDAPALRMRVGVVTGEVAVTVGASDEGMVAGDAVNTASRVQSLADPGSVWVDALTRSLTEAAVRFVEVGTHRVRGKTDPMPLWAATSILAMVGGELRRESIDAPLAGRQQELGGIKDLLDATIAGRSARLVVVTGEPGIGKSRLAWELEKYVDGLSADVFWHWGRCLSYGDGVAMSALRAAVRARIGAQDGDDEATLRHRLAESLAALVPDTDTAEWIESRLAVLLSAAGAYPREDLFAAWSAWFERLAASTGAGAAVWIVDDAHHADDATVDFARHLAETGRQAVFVVLIGRPELLARRPDLAEGRATAQVRLDSLPQESMRALLDGLVDDLPAAVGAELVRRSEGVPLYAIETVRALADGGLVVSDGARRRLAPGVGAGQLTAVGSPASLQILISSRLDALPRDVRSVLADAAVVGLSFDIAALEALGEPSVVPGALVELARRDLVARVTDPRSSELGQYAFVQNTVREVAYRTQSRRSRYDRHLVVADHLSARVEAESETAPVIARHLLDALASAPATGARPGLAGQAVRWLEQGAVRSEAVGALDQAASLWATALELVDDPEHLSRLLLAAADTALARGRYGEAVELTGRAVGAAPPDPQRQARCDVLAARALERSGQQHAALGLVLPWLDRLDALPPGLAAMLATEIASDLPAGGGPDDLDAQQIGALALRYAEDSAEPPLIAAATNALALAALSAGLRRVGLALLEHVAAYAGQHHLVRFAVSADINLANFRWTDDLHRALAHGRSAWEQVRRTGNVDRAVLAAAVLSVAARAAGEWDTVDALLADPWLHDRLTGATATAALVSVQAAVIAEARGDAVPAALLDGAAHATDTGYYRGYAALWPALQARGAGRAQEAAEHLAEALHAVVEETGLDDDFPHHWALATQWALDAGRVDLAREHLTLVDRARPSEVTPFLAAESLRLGACATLADPAATGADRQRAEQDLHAGASALDALGAVPAAARARAALGAHLARGGRTAEAVPLLAGARATFDALGAVAWTAALDAQLTG